jgi:hypothetical protein
LLVLAIASAVWENGGMQGSSRLERVLLDAAALCGQLVAEGSVYAFFGRPPFGVVS